MHFIYSSREADKNEKYKPMHVRDLTDDDEFNLGVFCRGGAKVDPAYESAPIVLVDWVDDQRRLIELGSAGDG